MVLCGRSSDIDSILILDNRDDRGSRLGLGDTGSRLGLRDTGSKLGNDDSLCQYFFDIHRTFHAMCNRGYLDTESTK